MQPEVDLFLETRWFILQNWRSLFSSLDATKQFQQDISYFQTAFLSLLELNVLFHKCLPVSQAKYLW